MAKYLDDSGLLYFWQKLKTIFAGKVDKEAGKGLSTNDYTTAEKTKLAGIQEMTAATSTRAGNGGLVPAPPAGANNSFLKGDGTWATAAVEDKRVQMTLNSASKAYVLSATETPTETSKDVMSVADTNVYLDRSTHTLYAPGFAGAGDSITNLNGSAISKGTVSPSYLPVVTKTTEYVQGHSGMMTEADKAKLDAFSDADTYAKKSDITSMYRHKGSVQYVENLPTSGNTAGDVYNVISTGMNYVWVNQSTGWDALGEIFVINSLTNPEIDSIMTN